MGVGARGARAALLLGALQVLALMGAAVGDSASTSGPAALLVGLPSHDPLGSPVHHREEPTHPGLTLQQPHTDLEEDDRDIVGDSQQYPSPASAFLSSVATGAAPGQGA
ncbi:hypothetical protein TREES_T100006580 [Tupaia chinensis]|uniref:Uncharacterized protein n=1 Tax=Tupaia chinensis TaxID=246437 RepID=L9KR48_TUPCH|nr:hypothetical protein TREES_T100006580 [Tupaia chinensis]